MRCVVDFIRRYPARMMALVALLVGGAGMVFLDTRAYGELSNGLRLGIAAAVLIAYAPFAAIAWRKRALGDVHHLILGIMLTWVSITALGIYGLLGRIGVVGSTSIQSSHVIGFIVYVAFVGGVLHLTAPGVAGGTVRSRNLWLLAASVAVGILVAGIGLLLT